MRRRDAQVELDAFVHRRLPQREPAPPGVWPRITIVTPSFNQAAYLEQSMLSVLNQNYPNLGYVVMDGGSIDGSVDIIRRHAGELAHWSSGPDGGQAAAIAKGFEQERGDICAWLNADDVYLPGALQWVASYFDTHASVELIYGDCLIIEESGRIARRTRPPLFDPAMFLLENSVIPQPAAFWRRDAYDRVGGVNPRFVFCMDYDLWARFLSAGVTPVRVDRILAGFRVHSRAKTARLEPVRRQEHREICERMLGRPLCFADAVRTQSLRLKRYWRQPSAMMDALFARAASVLSVGRWVR